MSLQGNSGFRKFPTFPKITQMKTVITMALLGLSIVVQAQRVQFGLKAGANINNFTGSSFDDARQNALIGFHGGVYTALFLGKHFAIQPEAMISTQGAKVEDAGQLENYSLTYVTVPVMVKYITGGGFYVEAGPQVGFKVSEDVPDQTINQFAKNLDLAVAGGLGWQSKAGLGLGFRYVAGLSKVGDFEASTANPDFRNGTIQIGLFYGFGGKK